MTCSTFVFIIPGSFWQLPKVLVIVGFVAVDTLWLTVSDKTRIYFGKIKSKYVFAAGELPAEGKINIPNND